MAVSDENRESFNALARYLADNDLGELFTIAADGTPGGWLWDRIVEGVDTPDELMIRLEQTPQFAERYAVILDMRKQAAQGKPVRVPTVAEVREYEQAYADVMRIRGLPAFLYDDFRDAQAQMAGGKSVREIELRVDAVWDRVTSTSPLVRAEFETIFGVHGDAAIAALMLDSTKSVTELERMARTAFASGYAREFGFTIDRDRADRLARAPFTDAGIVERFDQTARLADLAAESIGEVQDLTLGEDALDATVFGDAAARAAFERRDATRRAIERASFGGAASDRRGVLGLRTAGGQ